MKKVSLRDFQLKPSKYLDDLPIVLTRYGKEIAIIEHWSKTGIIMKEKEPGAVEDVLHFQPVPKPKKGKR